MLLGSVRLFDLVNGLFEIVGGLTQVLNIRQLMRDKQVKGVSWPVTGFFTAWGLWNLLYYPHLEQWFSFFGGILLVLTNSIWLALLMYYRKKDKDASNSLKLVRDSRSNSDLASFKLWLAERSQVIN